MMKINLISIPRPKKVLLNGIAVTRCLEADDEAGYIIRHKTDANDTPLLSDNKDAILLEKLFGEIEIIY